MSFPFGWMNLGKRRKARPFAKPKEAAIDPQGRRLLGFTLESNQPVWAPRGHSLSLASAGAGKTTKALMPWIFSMLASTDRPAILILDSKSAELYTQLAPMLEELGIPTALIDDTAVLPPNAYGRTNLNPLQSVVSTHLDTRMI